MTLHKCVLCKKLQRIGKCDGWKEASGRLYCPECLDWIRRIAPPLRAEPSESELLVIRAHMHKMLGHMGTHKMLRNFERATRGQDCH